MSEAGVAIQAARIFTGSAFAAPPPVAIANIVAKARLAELRKLVRMACPPHGHVWGQATPRRDILQGGGSSSPARVRTYAATGSNCVARSPSNAIGPTWVSRLSRSTQI